MNYLFISNIQHRATWTNPIRGYSVTFGIDAQANEYVPGIWVELLE